MQIDPIDLTKLTPGHIAALTAGATLLGALVAGVFALTVACVNGIYATHTARKNSQREFLLKQFQRYFAVIENDMLITQHLGEFALTLRGVHGKDAASTLDEIRKANASLKWLDVSGTSVLLHRTKRLSNAKEGLTEASERWRQFSERFESDLASRELKLGQQPWLENFPDASSRLRVLLGVLADYYNAAFALREACERYIFKDL